MLQIGEDGEGAGAFPGGHAQIFGLEAECRPETLVAKVFGQPPVNGGGGIQPGEGPEQIAAQIVQPASEGALQ
ncbi:hypothetical protein D3C71_2207100 [compost metagenome]